MRITRREVSMIIPLLNEYVNDLNDSISDGNGGKEFQKEARNSYNRYKALLDKLECKNKNKD